MMNDSKQETKSTKFNLNKEILELWNENEYLMRILIKRSKKLGESPSKILTEHSSDQNLLKQPPSMNFLKSPNKKKNIF